MYSDLSSLSDWEENSEVTMAFGCQASFIQWVELLALFHYINLMIYHPNQLYIHTKRKYIILIGLLLTTQYTTSSGLVNAEHPLKKQGLRKKN